MVTRHGSQEPDDRFSFTDEPQTESRNPLSMALLFYIVTVCAILSASLRTLISNPSLSTRSLSAALISGLVLGLFSGAAIGWYYLKGRFAAGVASCMGIAVGAAAGALSLVDGQHFLEMIGITFGGSWLLLLFMLASKRFAKPL